MFLYFVLSLLVLVAVVMRLLNYIRRKSPGLKQKLSIPITTLRVINTLLTLLIIWCFFFYPGFYSLKVIFSPALKKGDIPSFVIDHFRKTSIRFEKWGAQFIETEHASKIDLEHVAATEWPMFGSVYYLLAAEEIHKFINNHSDLDMTQTGKALQKAAKVAAAIVADPKTATWVENKWGPSYLTKENLFYRMLLIMGLSSYENISGDTQYRSLLENQAISLGDELLKTDAHLLDDYPGECYPNDVLWAVAAILRTDRILDTDHSELRTSLLKTLDTLSLTPEKVPAYSVSSTTGEPNSPARGCANSGILVFAPELDLAIANKWYSYHEKYFWKENFFIKGFREFTIDHQNPLGDVDTGPIVAEFGTVASAFGIGAARGAGRLDHAVPLTMEAIVLSWPTLFGFILPSTMGYVATEAAPLGEVALLFLMTRPILEKDITQFSGPAPGIVWLVCISYFIVGIFLVWLEYYHWGKFLNKNKPTR